MNEHGYHDEIPLPTYEEVIGASNHNIVFKDDVLLRPRPSNAGSQAGSELVRECVGVPGDEGRGRPSGCFVRARHWAKKYLAALVGVIITPLFFLFLILQLKSCGDCSNLMKETKSGLARLEKCKVEMSDILGRHSVLYKDLQKTKSVQEELLANKETEEREMKNLRLQYDMAISDGTNLRKEVTRLKNEIREYKILLKSQRNDDAALPKTSVKRTTEATAEAITKTTTADFLLPRGWNENEFEEIDELTSMKKVLEYLDRRFPKPTRSYN